MTFVSAAKSGLVFFIVATTSIACQKEQKQSAPAPSSAPAQSRPRRRPRAPRLRRQPIRWSPVLQLRPRRQAQCWGPGSTPLTQMSMPISSRSSASLEVR